MLSEVISSEGLTAVLGGTLALVCLLYFFGPRRNFPPGPIGLPGVGYMPFLLGKTHIKIAELAKKYGPVYSLRIGTRTVVFLCDFPSIKKAFMADALLGRPPESVFELNKETVESGAVNGLAWKDQRRFSLHLFRDLGLGKSRMENHIIEEIKELLHRYENEKDSLITPATFLAPSTSNNVSSLVFGKRRPFDDPKRLMLDRMLQKIGLLAGKLSWLAFFPTLQKLLRTLNIGPQKELSTTMREMKLYVREEIEEHQKTLESGIIRDYIDGYLMEIQRSKSNPNTTFNVSVLEDLVGMFFGAGSETIKMTVDWLLFLSAAFPEVQKRVQVEIEEAVGRERVPVRADSAKMPYTDATIMEVLRWRAGIQVNLPRYTLEDMELNSYVIPKHTCVVAVLWGMNHDPALWGQDADQFRPDRFLSADGKSVQKPEYFIPFSIGKRACPGESLAYMEVFMYYTAILQKFNLRLPAGATPDFDGRIGLGLQPTPYKLHFEIRQ